MNELDIKEILLFIKNKMVYIILTIILFFIGSIIYNEKYNLPYYKATNKISVFVVKEYDSGKKYTYIDNQVLNTYANIIKTKLILNDVSEKFKINYNDLKNMLNVETEIDSAIINISINNSDNKKSIELVNSVTDSITKNIKNIDKYNTVEINVIDYSDNANKYYRISKTKLIIIFILFSIILSVSTLIVIYYLTNKVRSYYQLQKYFNNTIEIKNKNSYNLLRNKLIENNIKSIYITTTKSNIKKFNITISLVKSFTEIKQKTLLINCDNKIKLSNYFNIKDIKNKKYKECELDNLYLLELEDNMKTIINNLDSFDIIIINGNSVLDNSFTSLDVNNFDTIFMVTKLNKDKINNIKESLNLINNSSVDIIFDKNK